MIIGVNSSYMYNTLYFLHSKLLDRDVDTSFSTDNATKLPCVNIQTAESQSVTVYLGGRYINAVNGQSII